MSPQAKKNNFYAYLGSNVNVSGEAEYNEIERYHSDQLNLWRLMKKFDFPTHIDSKINEVVKLLKNMQNSIDQLKTTSDQLSSSNNHLEGGGNMSEELNKLNERISSIEVKLAVNENEVKKINETLSRFESNFNKFDSKLDTIINKFDGVVKKEDLKDKIASVKWTMTFITSGIAVVAAIIFGIIQILIK